MKGNTYAIVDIETTGGHADKGGITEIAIYVHDGVRIIDSYQTLINPECDIPYHIQVLTGITPEMVADAPRFEDVGEQIFKLLEGKIFVAHNVNFDYSFVHAQFKKIGYTWKAPKLCTVRLSRGIFKGYASYSLGRICQSLDIPLTDRHRAAGDAKATVLLFEKILNANGKGLIDSFLQPHAKEQLLPTHIERSVFEELPADVGIYIFRNNKGQIIYVGKAINIRKRVLSHFTGNNTTAKRQLFVNEIHDIEAILSGTELMALLMEYNLIKKHWPVHNRALKQYEPKIGILSYEDMKGYQRLAVTKVAKGVRCILYFERPYEANQMLLSLIDEYGLDPLLCNFYSPSGAQRGDRNLPVESHELPTQALYNVKVYLAIRSLGENKRSYVIVDKGRTDEEQSYIYVKDNNLYAMGFIDGYQDIQSIEDMIGSKDLCTSNYYVMQLIRQYLESNPQKVTDIPSLSTIMENRKEG
ncbi:exonuclease domain-containing protein [Sphingobacterium sp. SYP-B4668]|uniref:exonuclease domain-containing protein n=1 Tax=Sphingobacterium sp. SYP-B4668 TaxID=2996035 RepID=UPI0022DD9D50|nr:exonuclease domain-containing protein [Sphingobacterium sp. SYP-B4668]